MSAEHGDPHEAAAELLVRLLRTGLGGSFGLGALLDEFDAWLADNRQWTGGGPQHWRSLIDDLLAPLGTAVSLASGDVQHLLETCIEDLKRLRTWFAGTEPVPDAALRLQLHSVSDAIRRGVDDDTLLLSAWTRIMGWLDTDIERAESGVVALRDVLDMRGHDADRRFDQMRQLLLDDPVQIAFQRGEPLPAARFSGAGVSATDRLALAEELLTRPPNLAPGIVWLEYLLADVGTPPTLELGEAATLYGQDYLASLIDQTPDNVRLPPEMRAGGNPYASLASWIRPSDPNDPAPGDPRVYVRLVLDPAAGIRLVAEGREIAEFLAAIGTLRSDNHDVWVLSESYSVPGYESSTSWTPVNRDKARDQLPGDTTALELARRARALSPHLPLRSPVLRTAARLLVWLREAGSGGNPARVVLCERVVEQVCGWAGLSNPRRFIEDFLKPAWTYSQIWHAIHAAYIGLRNATQWQLPLRGVIEVQTPEPPHSPQNYIGGVNLKAVLENIDALVQAAPQGSKAATDLESLGQRIEDRSGTQAWLRELAEEFDRRNSRLRRTRNALMHGGPLARRTVDDVSSFAMVLAYQALTPAVDFLLDDRDLIEGFLERQRKHRLVLSQLKTGTAAASDVLFWED